MKIVFLTTDDPIYLPAFFEQVFLHFSHQTQAVYIVPPLYKNQTFLQAIWRYYRTFGIEGVRWLAPRAIEAKARRRSIASACRRWDTPCARVRDVNDAEFAERLKLVGPDLIVSVSCPQIFRRPLLSIPSTGCLNVHGGILPDYRGIMPSFWMLANNEKRAGVSIYFMNEEIDAGDLCGQRTFDVLPDETYDSFLRRSKAVAANLLVEVLHNIEAGIVIRHPLDLSEGSYFSWPDPDSVKRFRAYGRRLC